MKITPERLIKALRFRLSKVYPDHLGDEFECPLCGTGLSYFLPLSKLYLKEWNDSEYIHPAFRLETLNFADYECPQCYGSDRDRLYALYLDEFLSSRSRRVDLIDFAPTKQLSSFIKKYSLVNYRSADLYAEDVDDKVDLTAMDIYPDGRFDFLISSHMLEHIPADHLAANELYRILRPGGRGIVMVPIDLSLGKTYENPDVTSDVDRWRHFGQSDHVRLYSKQGFIDRLESAGFTVEQLGAGHFGSDVFYRAGIHPRSVLYIVHK